MTIGSDEPAMPSLAGPLYVDASALAKLYFREPESEALNALLAGRRDLVASDLAVTEVVSSLARRRREGAIGSAVVRRAQRAMLKHLDAGVFQRAELTPVGHRAAERLLMQMVQVPLRAADALHVALAASVGCAAVVTYDRRLATAAAAIGLAVHPDLPEI